MQLCYVRIISIQWLFHTGLSRTIKNESKTINGDKKILKPGFWNI